MNNKLTYEDFKEGEIVKVKLESGWAKVTFPNIRDSSFFRKVNQFGKRKAIEYLINSGQLKKIKNE